MTKLPVINTAELSGLLAEALKLEQLLLNHPAGVAGYAQSALDLGAIYNEIAAIVNGGGVTEQDITAAHADAQTIHDNRPTPGPTPAPTDPTSIEYDTIELAKAAAVLQVGTQYGVIKRADGKFSIWPNIGPLPMGSVFVWTPW